MAGKTRIGNLAKEKWRDNPPGVPYPETWTPGDLDSSKFKPDPWKFQDVLKTGRTPVSIKKKRFF